jgi:hypothetical protein
MESVHRPAASALALKIRQDEQDLQDSGQDKIVQSILSPIQFFYPSTTRLIFVIARPHATSLHPVAPAGCGMRIPFTRRRL